MTVMHSFQNKTHRLFCDSIKPKDSVTEMAGFAWMNDSLHRKLMFWKPGTAWCSDFSASYTHMHIMSHPALEQTCTHYYKTAEREGGGERVRGRERGERENEGEREVSWNQSTTDRHCDRNNFI